MSRGVEAFLAVAAIAALGSILVLRHVRQPADLEGTGPQEKFGYKAATACAGGADAYLKIASKYAFKWDELGFFEQRFDHHLTLVFPVPDEPGVFPDPGILVLASNKVSIQNQYGAYQRVELDCYYDTKSEQVYKFKTVFPP